MKQKNDDGFVVLEKFNKMEEAMIVKGMLETNGVPCMVSDPVTATLMPFATSDVTGMVRLMVFKNDEERARKILASEAEPENYNDYPVEEPEKHLSSRTTISIILAVIAIALAIMAYITHGGAIAL